MSDGIAVAVPSELVQETLIAGANTEIKHFSSAPLTCISKAYASESNTGRCFVGKEGEVGNQRGILVEAGLTEVLPEVDNANKYYVWFEFKNDQITLIGS